MFAQNRRTFTSESIECVFVIGDKEISYTDENGTLRNQVKYYSYDKFGKNTAVFTIDHKKVADYLYDDLGRLASVINSLSETTSYEYDNLNNVIKQTTAGGSTTYKCYDEFGRLYQETDPLGKSESISYDLAGNKVTKKDRKGTEFTYTYDNLNRLKRESNAINANIQEFTYDFVGNTLTAKNAQGVTSYEYYMDGNLKRETTPEGKSISYKYNLDGTRLKMLDQFGKEITYGYDIRGRLKTVTVDSKTTTYEYYSDGSRKSVTYPEGVKEEYFYNECNNLKRLINKRQMAIS